MYCDNEDAFWYYVDEEVEGKGEVLQKMYSRKISSSWYIVMETKQYELRRPH